MDAIVFDKKGLLVSYHAFDGIYTTAWKTLGLPSMLPQLRRDVFELSYRRVELEMKIVSIVQVSTCQHEQVHCATFPRC
jgi:hypothetical protein